MTEVYTRSFSTVVFAGLFVGAILTLQFQLVLADYEALSMLGGITTSACVREVGPLIISFLLAGKIGAFTAAELGTMRVTEQIDAIECLGTDPLEYLVVPRFIAIVNASILLLVVGLLVSLAGSILVALFVAGVNPLQYITSIPRFAGLNVFAAGMFKSMVYGTIVAGVACHQGFTASGGAKGVGKAVTWAAIYTNLYIVLANFVTSQLIDLAGQLFREGQ
ncbi:ABC transporter permease [bacterium]|nr:ABC transporter permease [bacterium]